MKLPKPPSHLSAESRRMWEEIASEYELEAHDLRRLRLACEAWDRCQGARRALAKTGVIYKDRWGCPRKHPLVSVEENARLQCIRILRKLGIDYATSEAPRPPLPGGQKW